MTDKIPCTECNKMILPTTAAKTGGLCMPCSKNMNGGVDIHRDIPAINFNQPVPVIDMKMVGMVTTFISEFVSEHGKPPTFNQLPDEIKLEPGAAMMAKSQIMAAELDEYDVIEKLISDFVRQNGCCPELNDLPDEIQTNSDTASIAKELISFQKLRGDTPIDSDREDNENEYQEMTEDTVDEIKELMSRAVLSKLEKVTIYLLYKEGNDANDKDVTRCDGVPIGVSDETWPQYNGKPMEHLLTLDLDEMPTMKKGILENKRAISLFINDRDENEAFEKNNKDTSVMLLSNSDIERVTAPSGSAGKKITIIPIDVPVDVFSTEGSNIDEIIEIRDMLLDDVCAYVGGGPVWMQGDESTDNFLFQFDERLIDVNLGDSGVMYVFANTAFLQCA